MNAKDLRTEAALGDRSNDDHTKYAQGSALPCHRNKTYHDIGSNSLAKVDAPAARPCAVIGPDRVVPPPAATDVYHKKSPLEPWLTSDITYRRPPEYPHKLLDYQHPSRNISPRQTFQENMQRIMVPPSYNAVKLKEDHNFQGESNLSQIRNNKLNVPTESNTKYCDVPYTINPITNDQKNVRNSDISVSNMNTVLARSAPHGWPPTSSGIQAPKPFHQDLCQYPEYQNCAAPRPMVMARPHRTVHEEAGPVYPDGYYQHGNIRFKPYPQVKERYPQTRYEYVSNYSSPFHPPPPFPTHKYDLQKPLPPHPYPSYPQVPLKYLDSRVADPVMNGYQRSLNQQTAYNNIPYRNQVIHSAYGPVPGNCLPASKYYPYPPDAGKSMPPNKLPYDTNPKLYPDYDSNRNKSYPVSDAFYINEIARTHPTKGPVLPNYPTNVHVMPGHPYHRKEPIKGYEYNPHFRNMDHMVGGNGNLMSRFPSQFSPSAVAISPSDSNTSNDTNQTQGMCQEDCGYVSQSSTASVRSMDSIINRMAPDIYRRYDHRPYGHIIRSSAGFTKLEQSMSGNVSSKEKKDIDVRQFLQMWNEGEDEGGDNNNKEVIIKTASNNSNNSKGAANYEAPNQEQLYVLGLVNVPSEELGKYEHIQKVSKLPENIKGYNSIELLHQFEEVIESSNLNHYNTKSPTTKQFHDTLKNTLPMHGISIPSRPISPLDVEAKISQSVIHKEVGCNFEIKPCSPKMLNVEVATPVPTVIGERMIEKVSNPLINQPSIIHHVNNESRDDCNVMKSQSLLPIHDNTKIASCKMVNKPYGNKDPSDPVKTNYSIQDLESNSGVCLASLPRLDNDIELNFPEVNQQFINANKVDSVITSAPMKDLPHLEADHTHTKNRETETNVISSVSKRNLDKDFSKLSKYRKIKRKSSEPNTPESNVQALRTDSVIIKNPENCKYENMERSLTPETKPKEAQNNPINLSVNPEHREYSNMLYFGLNKINEDRSNEIAIDFSINSTESCNFTNIKGPEISPTENGSNVPRKEYKENLLGFTEHAAFSVDESLKNEKEMTKSEKTTCNLNTPAANIKESFDTPKISDKTVNSSEIDLVKAPKSKNTDKEALNKKMSTYNLLSPQEKEDTLNEKMRELFGEELSTVEADPDFQQIHDTQASLHDESIETIKKDYVFSDESSQTNQEDMTLTCSMIEQHEKEAKDSTLCELALTEKSKECMDLDIKDKLSSDEICVFDGVKIESIYNNEGDIVVSDKENDLRQRHTYECVIQRESKPKTDLCYFNKELLSPWIQKLIEHDEGSCVIAAVEKNVSGNYCTNITIVETTKSAIFDEKLENYTLAPITKMTNDCEDVDQLENVNINALEVINIKNKKMDNKHDTHTKDLQTACVQETEEVNFDNLESNITDDLEIENSKLCCDLASDKAEVLETTNVRISDKDMENNDILKNDAEILSIGDSNKFDKKITSDTETILKISDAHETDKYSKESGVLDMARDSKNCEIIASDTPNITKLSDFHESNEHLENYESLEHETNNEVLKIASNNTSFAKAESITVNIFETPVDNQNDENMMDNVLLRDTEVLGMPNDNKSSNEVENRIPKVVDISNGVCAILENCENTGDPCTNVSEVESDGKNCDASVSDTTKVEEMATQSEIDENVELDVKLNTLEDLEMANSCIRFKNNAVKFLETNDNCKNRETLNSSMYNLEKTVSCDIHSHCSDKVIDTKNDQEIVESESYNVVHETDQNKREESFNFDSESDLDMKELNSQDNKEFLLSARKLNELNCHSNLGHWSLNHTPTEILSPLSPDEEMDEIQEQHITPDEETSEIHELNDNNMSETIAVSLNDVVKDNTDISVSVIDKKDNLMLPSYKCETECIPTIISSSEVNENARAKPIIVQNPMPEDLEASKTSLPDNLTANEPTSELKKICNEHLDSDFSNLPQTNVNINQPTCENVSNIAENVELNAYGTNETELLEELTSCSDVSDETSTSGFDNTSESSDSNMFQNNEDTKLVFGTVTQHFEGDKDTVFGNQGLLHVKSNDLIFDKEIHCVDQFKDPDDLPNNKTHENCNMDQNFSTSNVQTVETQCSSINITNSEEVKERFISKPLTPGDILSESALDRVTVVKELSAQEQVALEDCPNTVNFSHNLQTTNVDENLSTSNVQIVETQRSSITINNCEENIMESLMSKQLTPGNILRKTAIDRVSVAEDHSAQVLEALEDLTDTVNCSHTLQTTNVDENVMNDSGIMLETSQEQVRYECLEDTNSNEARPPENSKNVRYSTRYLGKRRKSLKRSLSDSALDDIRDNLNEDCSENSSLLWPNKRKKDDEINDYNTSKLIAENICHVLQNRRNSISSIHNEGNVSFCILIDNDCIISEECDEPDRICFSEVPDDCLACIQEESLNQEDSTAEIISIHENIDCDYSTPVHTNVTEDDKSTEEPWVEDVACVETVVSDDIAEDIVISASSSPKDNNDEETELYNINEHTDKLKFIYGDKIYNDDAHFVETLYRTPQMNVNKTLNNRESHITDDSHADDGSRYYDKESLERVLSESNVENETATELLAFRCRTPLPSPVISELTPDDNENFKTESCNMYRPNTPEFLSKEHDIVSACHIEKCEEYSIKEIKDTNFCESSCDDVFNYKKIEESPKCTTSSSPEVSSTTSEEKNSGIMLKISTYGGSRVSQLNDINPLHRISCKYTEKKDYLSSNGNLPTKTLLTKGAQKYIPPLKETIPDLKVKLPLPQQSLIKLRQLKLTKDENKPNADRPTTYRKEVPKKPKPKFEDVLKSIDEIQYQKHKEKNKKGRKSIPKVVIKKNEHGSHYASTSSKHQFNPDLTGMKWQPWVFLEKDKFIDSMALRKKTRAIFSYRKNSFVLAEKFRKYKSICHTKFVISQPKQNDSTTGQLKYTIRLKHSY